MIESPRILDDSADEQFSLKLSGKAFGFAKSVSGAKHFAFVVASVTDLNRIGVFSRITSENLSFKLIGAKTLIGNLALEIKKHGHSIEKEIIKNDEFHVVYQKQTGRVRLLVEAETAPKLARKFNVLIVDDSPSIQKVLKKIFSSDPEINVVGEANSAAEALEILKSIRPDVITLDVQMPGMTGVEFLRQHHSRLRIPTVLFTSLRKDEGSEVLDGLALGAIDYIQKPELADLANVTHEICEKIKTAACANLTQLMGSYAKKIDLPKEILGDQILAIGSSTGGTEALKALFSLFPTHVPPTVIVQHIPPVFSKAFAERMNDLFPFEVKEAEDGDEIKVDRVLIAPGGKQMRVKSFGGRWFVKLFEEGPVNRHCPSVDVLFDSVAQQFGAKSVGVILTGMGADGAKGLLNMKQSGAATIAQSEKSCTVFGMPRVAIELGGVDSICDLEQIPTRLFQIIQKYKKPA